MLLVEEKISAGYFTKLNGIKGHVVLQLHSGLSLNEDIQWVFIRVHPNSHWAVPFEIDEMIQLQDERYKLLLHFANSMDEAEKYIGKEVWCNPQDIEGENIAGIDKSGLVGMYVQDESGKKLGVIENFLDIPNNPLLEISFNRQQYMIPINEDIILGATKDKKGFIVRLPEGIINLND